jgi:pimeloyl-ACP methyl ester carboxylesterase
MSRFILVHGAWMGAWCWDHVAKDLRESGHEVLTPELPGHGEDQTPLAATSLAAYVDTVGATLQADPGQSVLVGHSMAGVVISQLAERIPEKISALVYLAAYLLKNGETITKASQAATDSLVGPNMVPAPDWSTISIRTEGLKDVFAADAPESDLARILEFARPEPSAPFNATVEVTQECFGQVPRFYIQTSRDRAVTPMLQDRMLAATSCQQIFSMNTSHTPFFSAPQELAEILTRISMLVQRSTK